MGQLENGFDQTVSAAKAAGLDKALRTPTLKGRQPAIEMWLEAHPEHNNSIVRAFIVSRFIEEGGGKRPRLSEEDYYAGVLG